MSFVLVVNIRIKPENVARWMTMAMENAREARKEPGCRQFDVLVDPKDKAKVLLFEIYDDEKAFEAHQQTAHFKKYLAEAVPLLASRERHRDVRERQIDRPIIEREHEPDPDGDFSLSGTEISADTGKAKIEEEQQHHAHRADRDDGERPRPAPEREAGADRHHRERGGVDEDVCGRGGGHKRKRSCTRSPFSGLAASRSVVHEIRINETERDDRDRQLHHEDDLLTRRHLVKLE